MRLKQMLNSGWIDIPDKYLFEDIKSLPSFEVVEGKNVVKYQDITQEIFDKLYFNSDDSYKQYLIKPVERFGRYVTKKNSFSYMIGMNVEPLITKEIADDILSINISTIWHIPEQYITQEIATKAVNTSPFLISFIPARFQTIEIQKKVIDDNSFNLSLINPTVLKEEMIYYAINKDNKRILGSVPKERRTYDVCNYAVERYGEALRYVPNNLKTKELCIKAIKKSEKVIYHVPLELLTEDFIKELNDQGVIIPLKRLGYVRECLEVNRKLDEEVLEEEKVETSEEELKLDEESANIRLDSIPELLTADALKLLNNKEIYTVGDLLEKSQNPEFSGEFIKGKLIREVRGVINLLKCKYLNIDPLIDIYSDDKIFLGFWTSSIGICSRTDRAFAIHGITPKKFYEMMHSKFAIDQLYKIPNIGDRAVSEIMFKGGIIADFYDKKKQRREVATEDETIDDLNNELKQIKEEIEKLNKKTDMIIAKIQKKLLENNKGGISR